MMKIVKRRRTVGELFAAGNVEFRAAKEVASPLKSIVVRHWKQRIPFITCPTWIEIVLRYLSYT